MRAVPILVCCAALPTPFATGAQLGLGADAHGELPYIMSAGTYEAHVMGAGETRPWAERGGLGTVP